MKQTFFESNRFRLLLVAIITTLLVRFANLFVFTFPPPILEAVSGSIAALAAALIVVLSFRNTVTGVDGLPVKEPFFESQRVQIALVTFLVQMITLFLPMLFPDIPVDTLAETIFIITGLSAAYIGARTFRNTDI